MAETLEGKVVLITGASGRIGLGMAQAFHAAGARVALGDLHQCTVEGAAADLEGERTFAGVVDVRDASSVRNFFAAAERALGPVEIVVANAGVFPTLAVLDMDVEEWDRVIEINLRGTFLTCQAAARSMVAGKRPGKSSRSPLALTPARALVARLTAPRRPVSSCSPKRSPWSWRRRAST